MSLEAALDRNTAAIEKQTALMEKLAGGKAAATTTAPAASTPAKTAAKPAAAKAPTTDDLRFAAGNYLGVTDPAEREARKANVKSMIDHFGVGKVTEIPAENIAEAIGYFKTLTEGGTPDFMNEAAAEDDMV